MNNSIRNTNDPGIIFCRYLQIRSFIQNLNNSFSCQISQRECLLLDGRKKSLPGPGYTELSLPSSMSLDYLQHRCCNDLNVATDERTWVKIWQFAKEISICNKTSKTQFRISHHFQITPQLRHRMNPSLSEMCSKC